MTYHTTALSDSHLKSPRCTSVDQEIQYHTSVASVKYCMVEAFGKLFWWLDISPNRSVLDYHSHPVLINIVQAMELIEIKPVIRSDKHSTNKILKLVLGPKMQYSIIMVVNSDATT